MTIDWLYNCYKSILLWLKYSIVPKITITGIVLSCAIFLVWPLPDRLSQSASLELVSQEGILLAEFREVRSGSYRNWINLESLPQHFVDMLLLAEDKRFYYTPGIDPLAILRAAYLNISKKRIVSGASGINMQLIRILYSDQLPKNIWFRKPIEMYLAIKLSFYNSDHRILEAWINTVPMAMNRGGIPATSGLLFGRDLSHTTPEEMACLVVLIRQSSVTLKTLERRLLRFFARYNQTYNQNLKVQLIPQLAKGVLELDKDSIKKSQAIKNKTPHFVIHIKNKFPGLQGKQNTTISNELNYKIDEILKNEFPLLEKRGAQDASVVVLENMIEDQIENHVQLKALVGSRNFYNKIDGQINGALIQRNAGSSLKPFVYGLAFDRLRLRPFDTIEDSEISLSLGDGATYRPRNYDLAFWGRMTIREALATSRNIPAVRLVDRLKVPVVYNFFLDIGLRLDKEPEHYGPGIALGSGGARLLDLTHAYSIFPNKGYLYPLTFLKNDPLIKPLNNVNKKMLGPGAAYYIGSILSDRIARRRSFGVRNFLDFPFEVAAKTGTSKDYRDSWTIGYTGRFIVGVWVGRFSGGPMSGVSGSVGAGRIFHQTMRILHEQSSIDNSTSNFTPPEGWQQIKICSITGKKAASLCPVHEEWVANDNQPSRLCPRHQSLADRKNQNKELDQHVSMNREQKKQSDQEKIENIKSQNANTKNGSIRIISPVANEVYLIDPHTPLKIQEIPVEIELPEKDQHPDNRYFFRMDNNAWIEINGHYKTTIPASPGIHKIEIRQKSQIIERVEYIVNG